MGVISTSTLPFLPETHVFSTLFKLLQANSTLFKHLWLVTPILLFWLQHLKGIEAMAKEECLANKQKGN